MKRKQRKLFYFVIYVIIIWRKHILNNTNNIYRLKKNKKLLNLILNIKIKLVFIIYNNLRKMFIIIHILFYVKVIFKSILYSGF